MDLPSYEQIYSQIQTMFWLMGIKFNDPKIYYRFYFLLFAIILQVIEEVGFFVSRITSDNYNVLKLSELAPCLCIGVLSALKIIFLVKKKKNIFELKDCLEKLYEETLENSRSVNLVGNNVILIYKFLKYFLILNLVLICVYNFAPPVVMIYNYYIAKGTFEFILPYPILVPFSTDMWATWLIVYLHSISCGFICIIYFTTSDGLFCVLTSHICNNFKILSDKIKNMDVNQSPQYMREIFQRHQYLLKLANDLEEIYQLPNLFNYLVGSLEICALGFSITIGPWSRFVGYVLFLLSVLLQILMMSVFGENIIRESRKVGEAAYLCKWYEMSAKTKKTMLVLMIRANKQQQFTAFKFSVISYSSFSKIISTSWSYFTILKTVYKPQE